MSHLSSPIAIRTAPADVMPLVGSVRQHADLYRKELGFLPSTGYAQAANRGRLWVALDTSSPAEQYVGHLLFGGTFPHFRVFQLFVVPQNRQAGIASALIGRLVEEAEALSYLSISAKVADDLAANKFWERSGFVKVRTLAGGKSRNRLILLRQRQLSTPTLFDILTAANSPTDQDLRLVERLYDKAPVYAFDLNVLFDLTRNRRGASQVRQIIGAAMTGLISLCVAPEFLTELSKTSTPGQRDPLLEFVATLPQFPDPPKDEITRTSLELASLVFPDRARRGQLSQRDKSDLAHLATAIHHRAAGFITSEKAMLRASRFLQERYRLDVVGLTELAEYLISPDWVDRDHLTVNAGDHAELQCVELNESERHQAQAFLELQGIEAMVATDALSSGHRGAPRRRVCFSSVSGKLVAFASWDAPKRLVARTDAFVAADHAESDSLAALEYAFFLMMKDVSRCGPTLVRLCSAPDSPALRLAEAHGFRPTAASSSTKEIRLQKVCLGRVVLEEDWGSTRKQLMKASDVAIPRTPPQYCGLRTSVEVTSPRGSALSIPLLELEDLIGPTLLMLPGRSGAIVPIRRQYADQLLATSDQAKLFPKYGASLLKDRIYYSDRRALKVLTPGTVLMFYESQKDGGRGMIVACGRATTNALCRPADMPDTTKRRGVLEDRPIQTIAHGGEAGITWFDTVMRLSKPISLGRLRELGCVDGSNLITSRRIGYEDLCRLLREGSPRVD